MIDQHHLYEVDPFDGTTERVGASSWGKVQGMTFRDGLIYIVENGQLFYLNPNHTNPAPLKLGADWEPRQGLLV